MKSTFIVKQFKCKLYSAYNSSKQNLKLPQAQGDDAEGGGYPETGKGDAGVVGAAGGCCGTGSGAFSAGNGAFNNTCVLSTVIGDFGTFSAARVRKGFIYKIEHVGNRTFGTLASGIFSLFSWAFLYSTFSSH